MVGVGLAVTGCVGDSPVVGPDAAADAGDGAAVADADADASETVACDAGIGRFPSAFGVCGDAGGVICVAPDAGLCAPSAVDCSIEQGAAIQCTSGTDCPGQHCCITVSVTEQQCPWQMLTLSGAACSATCGTGTFQVCEVGADCAVGTCHAVAAPYTTTGTYGVCK